MRKWQYCLCWIGAFLLVSCSDISQFCKHTGIGNSYLLQYQQLLSRHTAQPSPAATAEDRSVSITATDPPRRIRWNQLKDVVFNRVWDEKLDMPMLYPQFSRNIKALNGLYIIISGYVIPLDVKGGVYVLSANPNSSCFFCGGAGPESVMTLKLKKGQPRFETDDYLSFQGTLRLNEKNIYELYYNLDRAEAVGE
ncbi:hypothetical protein KTO58_25090 [Chitinophaga pendula]|uniref:DUF3299 domain-containing protein n=1 Tax=Chitinophaga TaxID=79328 RepID=UPI000BAF6828|nr:MULTISPECIES: DUF3299 domain-containing protein [Chitinophaga]ASZ10142.1 DUF3299 domain-containing protein [Chitinophaga sp. MD30]UCJ06904.1 hypothetical protein KTO58_25090 [Chitinophaga pendula]